MHKITFSSYNPATGQIIWEGKQTTFSEIDQAMQKAELASESWSACPLQKRAQYLLAFSEIVRKNQKNLAEIISLENGKPLWESTAEVESVIQKTAISLEAHDMRCGEIIREQANARSVTRHRPHGVVGVLGPYNFPAHLPCSHIIPALLAGNTVLYKPSELTPLVGEKIMELWRQANLPDGVLNMVQGGKDVGEAIASHSALQGLFFTGSGAAGLSLLQKFALEPSKILVLEMGGNNPLIVGDVDDLRAAAYTIIQSIYLSSGQRCTSARRLILTDKARGDNLIAQLIKMMQTIVVGPFTQIPEPFMGPVISEKQAIKVLEAERTLHANGGKYLVKMNHLQPGTGFLSPGLIDVTHCKNRPDEEIFGPLLQVIYVNGLPEAIKEANHTKFGLSAGLLSDKEEEYNYFYGRIRAGIINWNMPLTGASSRAPFGGIKCSGNHRPSAYYAADYCSYPVASMEKSKGALPSFTPSGISF